MTGWWCNCCIVCPAWGCDPQEYMHVHVFSGGRKHHQPDDWLGDLGAGPLLNLQRSWWFWQVLRASQVKGKLTHVWTPALLASGNCHPRGNGRMDWFLHEHLHPISDRIPSDCSYWFRISRLWRQGCSWQVNLCRNCSKHSTHTHTNARQSENWGKDGAFWYFLICWICWCVQLQHAATIAGEESMYVSNSVIHEAFASSGLVLDFYKSYNSTTGQPKSYPALWVSMFQS